MTKSNKILTAVVVVLVFIIIAMYYMSYTSEHNVVRLSSTQDTTAQQTVSTDSKDQPAQTNSEDYPPGVPVGKTVNGLVVDPSRTDNVQLGLTNRLIANHWFDDWGIKQAEMKKSEQLVRDSFPAEYNYQIQNIYWLDLSKVNVQEIPYEKRETLLEYYRNVIQTLNSNDNYTNADFFVVYLTKGSTNQVYFCYVYWGANVNKQVASEALYSSSTP